MIYKLYKIIINYLNTRFIFVLQYKTNTYNHIIKNMKICNAKDGNEKAGT